MSYWNWLAASARMCSGLLLPVFLVAYGCDVTRIRAASKSDAVTSAPDSSDAGADDTGSLPLDADQSDLVADVHDLVGHHDTTEVDPANADATETDGAVDIVLDGADVLSQDASQIPDAFDDDAEEVVGQPVSCADLPALCGVSGCSPSHTAKSVPFSEYLKKLNSERAAHAFYGQLAFDAVSFWLPVKIEQTGPATVRVHASWFNHVRPSPLPQVAAVSGKCDTCQLLKTSLLPTGCMVLDLDMESYSVIGQMYTPTVPAAFDQATTSWFDEVACAAATKEPPSWQAIVLETSNGKKVRVHPGRASVHAMLSDPEADISPIVRDIGLPGSATVVVAPVIDVTLPGAPSPTQFVAVDVSVCHAAPAQLTSSGCTCPSEPVPVVPPISPNETWLEFVAGPFEVTVTHGFLAALEPGAWAGVGVPKPAQQYSLTACCWGCDQMEPDWSCAGWLQTTMADPAMVEVDHLRYRWLPFDMHISTQNLAPPATGTWMATTLNSQALAWLGVHNGLAPRTIAPKVRDSAWTTLDHVGKPKIIEIQEWGPEHTQFSIQQLPVRICRRFAPLQAPVDQLIASPLCKFELATVRGRVVVDKPGAPIKQK